MYERSGGGLCKNKAAAILSVSLWLLAGGMASAADLGVELGAEDDLTVFGAGGTVPDPDVEIKGFSLFGSTDVLTYISTAPGNTVFNGAVQVSSDIYVTGRSTFTAPLQIWNPAGFAGSLLYVSTGTSNVIRMTGAGEIYANKFYGDISGASGLPSGDNLGDHTAAAALDMAGWNVVNVSSVNFRFNVVVASAAAAQYGGVYVSTHIYTPGSVYADRLFGDGSGLTGLSGASPEGSALTSASIWVGDASNVAAAVSMSGEGSLSNIGAFTLSKAITPTWTGAHTFNAAVTASSITATGTGVRAAQVRLDAASNVVISSEASAALGKGVRVSTNVYIVGFASATKYFGDGSSLTGLGGTLSDGQAPRLPYWTAVNTLGNSNLSRDSATSLTAMASSFTAQGALGVGAYQVRFGQNLGISSSVALGFPSLSISTAVVTPGIIIGSGGQLQTTGVGLGAVAGNARGAGAVDLQVNRNNALQAATGGYAVLSGGQQNMASGDYSVLAGGSQNTAGNQYSSVGGGVGNSASGVSAVVPGGTSNIAGGAYSFAAGRAANSSADGAFTWADSQGVAVVNDVADRVRFKARGGFIITGSTDTNMTGTLNRGILVTGNGLVGISTGVPEAALDVVSTGTTAAVYAQIWRNSAGTMVSSMTATGEMFLSSLTVSSIRGLAAPLNDDAAATKAYVDAALDTCALGSATTADIVQGKTADINCDNFAEAGTLATQTLAVSTDEVKAGVYAATWLSAVDTDLAPANIRAGYDIFGHAGSFTAAATAAAGDIRSGLTAGVNGAMITGTLPTQTLSPVSNNVNAGYYNATTLSAVDADLAAANIAVSTVIFGVAGTYTSDANAVAADMLSGKTAYVNGVKITGSLATQTLDPASNNVNAGYYNATTLSAVDADLAAANIAVSTVIFGVAGTYTSDANAVAADMLSGKTAYVNGVKITGTVPAGSNVSGGEGLKTFTITDGLYSGNKTATANDADLAAGNIKSGVTIFGVAGTLETAPPAPAVGGTWLLVPGDSSLGTMDFWVQKYEAKNVSSVPTSEPSGTPWVSVTQTTAKLSCEALGPGYHLLTMPEVQTINRNIENNAWNWTGGSVGSGGLWRGHTDNSPANSLAADITGDPDDDPYVGTGNTTPSIERRVHQLSSGQSLWDWSGNVWEWVDMTCTAGTGAGYWYNSAAWVEWSDGNLSDYEKGRAGPAGAYTSTHNAGRYYGCSATGNAVFRGGNWANVAYAGVFAFNANGAPSASHTTLGFRCGR